LFEQFALVNIRGDRPANTGRSAFNTTDRHTPPRGFNSLRHDRATGYSGSHARQPPKSIPASRNLRVDIQVERWASSSKQKHGLLSQGRARGDDALLSPPEI